MKAKLTNKYIQSLNPEICDLKHYDTDVANFYLRVNKASMVFCYRIRINGKENTFKLGRYPDITIAQARELAKRAAGEIAGGIDVQQAKKEKAKYNRLAKKTTLGGYIKYVYQDHLLTERKTGAKILQAIQSHFGKWENRQLVDISPFLVGNWRKQQIKAGKAPGTVNRPVAYLRALLNHAYHTGVIEKHPLATFKQIHEDKGRVVRYLSKDEEGSLRDALASRDEKARLKRETANQWRKDRGYSLKPEIVGYSDYLTPLVLLALNTGMRRGELFNLQWPDISLKGRYLTIHGHSAKSGKTRHIPLNDESFAVLVKWRNRSVGEGYLFTVTGKRLDNINTAFANLLMAAGVTDFRFHDLRHTFASNLAMAAVDLNTIRELLGHSDLQMTMRYAHLSPDVKQNAVSLLNKSEAKS